MDFQKKHWIFVLLGVISLGACSEDAATSAKSVSASASTVLIEREKRWDDEKAYIRLIRQTVQTCQSAKAAGGVADSQVRSISDAEILQLETERTLEAFDGARYTMVKTFSQIDRQKWGPLEGESCIPVAMHNKTMEIRQSACDAVLIAYDLDHGKGTKEEQRIAPCEPMASRQKTNALTGEQMSISGTSLTCRWSAPASELGRTCLLEPWLQYPGSAQNLEVAAQVKAPSQSNGLFQMVVQAVDASEHPLRVEVGKALPAGIFDVPDDAKRFSAP